MNYFQLLQILFLINILSTYTKFKSIDNNYISIIFLIFYYFFFLLLVIKFEHKLTIIIYLN